jgi:hypothetical protein
MLGAAAVPRPKPPLARDAALRLQQYRLRVTMAKVTVAAAVACLVALVVTGFLILRAGESDGEEDLPGPGLGPGMRAGRGRDGECTCARGRAGVGVHRRGLHGCARGRVAAVRRGRGG